MAPSNSTFRSSDNRVYKPLDPATKAGKVLLHVTKFAGAKMPELKVDIGKTRSSPIMSRIKAVAR